MTTAAVRTGQDTNARGPLYMAFELGERQWKLGFTIRAGQKTRRRTKRPPEQRRTGDRETAVFAVAVYGRPRQAGMLGRRNPLHNTSETMGEVPMRKPLGANCFRCMKAIGAARVRLQELAGFVDSVGRPNCS